LRVRALRKCDSDKRLADGDERAFVKSTGVGNTWPPMNRQTSSNINFSRYLIIDAGGYESRAQNR